ncbi:MAG: ATP-binding protein, partial [Deltaproteobacteria bacterium]|nr:ATP-binding protein [Deltaproteobacteria bacterium]
MSTTNHSAPQSSTGDRPSSFARHERKNPDLLIIDEVGYLPCKNDAVDAFFNVISRRHEINSTILTTNLAFKEWGKLFQGAACLSALVDRFVQHCHVMDIDATSWRKKLRWKTRKRESLRSDDEDLMHSGKRRQALQRCNLPRDTRVLAVIFSQAVRSSTLVGGRFFTARR